MKFHSPLGYSSSSESSLVLRILLYLSLSSVLRCMSCDVSHKKKERSKEEKKDDGKRRKKREKQEIRQEERVKKR